MVLHVGGVQTPETRDVVSREVSLSVQNGPVEALAQVVSRELGLMVATAEVPPPVGKVAVTTSPTGETVTLDWSAYNQWAVRDIVRFDIYLSDAGPFTSVAGRPIFRSVPAESTTATLTGLAPYMDHFLAVVAVDALGQFNPDVAYSAAYVLTAEVVSREVALSVQNGPAEVHGQAVSREMGLVNVTAEPPPPIVGLNITLAADGTWAVLDWGSYNQWAARDIVRFDVYASDTGPFTGVAGLAPTRSVPAESVSVRLDGLAEFTDHFFAVVPVDGLGNFEANVVSSGGYLLSPQVVSREVALRVDNGPAEAYSQVISREVGLMVPDAAIPEPVTGVGSGFQVSTSSSAFGAVDLDWTSYNEIAQRDVYRYRIFVGTAFFEDVTGLTPHTLVPAGAQRYTLQGLDGLGIYYFAVVAEDAAGNFNPMVRASSGQASISGVGEVRDLAVTSGVSSLDFSWAAPTDAGSFLAGYRIYFGTADPVDLAANVTQWRAEGLAPAQGYPFRITTRDVFGQESAGRSVIGATFLPNPQGVSLTAIGDEVVLSWDPVTPESLVGHYAVYRGPAPFSSVAGLSPITTLPGSMVVVGTIASVTGNHFAVATVNLVGGTDPAVISVSGTKQTQTVDFPLPGVGPIEIPLGAVASSGLPVRFIANAPAVATIEGSILRVLQGGNVTVTARQDGNEAYWPAQASHGLRLPPVITSFSADGVELVEGAVLTQVEALFRVQALDQEGVIQVRFYGRPEGAADWIHLGTDTSVADGWTLHLSLVALPRGRYQGRVVVETASGAMSERIRAVELAPILRPDLAIREISVPATVLAGQPVQVGWVTANTGMADLTGGWATRLSLSPAANGANAVSRGTISTEQGLTMTVGVGQAATFLVPANWVGPAYLVVDLDPDGAIIELDEANNRGVAMTPMVVFSPDLAMGRVQAPAAGTLGAAISVTWGVTNVGSAPTFTTWHDRIWLTPTAGSRVGGIELGSFGGPAGGLPPGTGYERTESLALPWAPSMRPGAWFLLLEADADQAQPETSEANNTAFPAITLVLPPVPDLVVRDVLAPSVVRPGASFEPSWTTANQGAVGAEGVWREALSISNALHGLRELALLTVSNALPSGGGVVRNATLTLPSVSPAGDYTVWVKTDAQNQVVESDEDNNATAAAATLHIPQVLTLTLSASQIREDATQPVVAATVIRNGPASNPLVVTLSGVDPSELTLPAHVIVPAGQTAIAFEVGVVADGIVDGPQDQVLIATAEGYESAAADLRVLDGDLYALFVTVDPLQVVEGHMAAGTVRREGPSDEPLAVAIVSSAENQLSPTPFVMIPAGQDTATFGAIAVDDAATEGTREYTLVASAAGFLDGSATVTVLDNDLPSVVLTIASPNVSEGAGPQATSATVTRSPVGLGSLTVEIVPSDPSLVLAPNRVTIAGGRASRSFPVGVIDDSVVNGPRNVVLGGYVLAMGTDARLAEVTPAVLTVTDDDGPTLRLVADRKLVREGEAPATVVTVGRNTVPTGPLDVTLSSSDVSEATVPVGVTIPAGSTSATFPLATISDGINDGNQSVTLTASAAGYVDGTETVVVSDRDLPDLIVETVGVPATGTPRQRVDVSYRLSNQGLATASQSVLTRVYISRDAIVGGDDVLAAQSRTTTALAVGQGVDRTETVELPLPVGNYWVVIETDVEQALDEVLENNNTAISAHPIVVAADYGAWVATDTEVGLAGMPVAFRGEATNHVGAPVGGVPVTVHVRVRGTERKLSAVTDASGSFNLQFMPLPGEGGQYAIFATHPGVAAVPPQDAFVLLGLRADPAGQSVFMVEGTSRTFVTQLRNLADVPLTGLAAEVIAKPADLEVDMAFFAGGSSVAGGRSGGVRRMSRDAFAGDAGAFSTVAMSAAGPSLHANGSDLPGLATIELRMTLSAPSGAAGGPLRIRVTTAEGVQQEVHVQVRVEPEYPRLVAHPPSLVAAMAVGRQTIVEFELVNRGGRASEPLQLFLPGVIWMTLANTNPLPPLAPGETNRITLLLTPPADLSLGQHSGSLAIQAVDAGLAVPFQFRAVSEARGDLAIEVVDEYTYYATGAPRVAGATVTVRDAVDQTVAATGVTGEDGRFTVVDLLEGHYDVEVRAEKHTTYRATHRLLAGQRNEIQAFVSRQTVTYTWTVEPVEIEDRYKVTIETTFETVVPVPVITVEPSVIDLALLTEDETQVNVTVTNHGLIAADNTHLAFPSHPLWEFVSLIDQIGTLPARTSVTVPLTIRRRSAGGPSLVSMTSLATTGGGGPCHTLATVCWELICGNLRIPYCATVALVNANTGCGTPPQPGGGGGGGGGIGGGAYVPPSMVGTPLICDPACLLVAALSCIPGPVGCGAGLGSCINGLRDGDSDPLDYLDCVLSVVSCFPTPASPFICIYSLLRCILPSPNPSGGVPALAYLVDGGVESHRIVTGHALAALPGGFAGDTLAPYRSGVTAIVNALNELTGGESGGWFTEATGPDFGNWLELFQGVSDLGSDAGRRISAVELAALLNIGLPEGVTEADVRAFVDRWHRTLDNWNRGILNRADAPAGESRDFVDFNRLRGFLNELKASQLAAARNGYSDPIQAIVETTRERVSSGEDGGVCARVKLRLEQEAVMTRDAFRATLEIDNDGDTRLENVGVEIVVRSESGEQVATDRFDVRFEGATAITAVDGTGIVAGHSTGSARWLLLPTVDAAPEVATVYLVGGMLRYRQNGTDVAVPLYDVRITVLPSPRLSLQYFHQRDVFSDDPFTDEIEPAVPYNLAVMVENGGYGLAKNFRITSAQPVIVENEKGLLIDFQIVASEVAGHPVSPSLTVNMGDIGPGQRTIARWLLTSSLQGLFIDYSATFELIDGLGNPRLSLIDNVSIHELIHLVQADRTFEDGKPDFLVNEIPDSRDLPDTLYLSDGRTNRVALVEQGTLDAPPSAADLEVELTTPMPSGWAYLRIPDPADGRFTLVRVLRPDGTEVSLRTNVWVTDRTFIGFSRRPARENILHLLDYNSHGRYRLSYATVAESLTDDVPPTSAVEALPSAVMPWFQVRWSGQDQGRLGEPASGIAFFDVFVSVNEGPFVPWLRQTRLVGATYTGEPGTPYSFYSVATDAAGNREESPSGADATTMTSRMNAAPVLQVPETVGADEGTLVTFMAQAIDADGAAQTLTFALSPGHPPGALIDPTSGRVSWPTGEEDGGTVRTFTIVVADNGVPSLSATGLVQVIVREVNTPPIAVGDAVTRLAGQRIRIAESQLLANDIDVDGSPLTVVAVAGPSVNGATIMRHEGWITYLPLPGDDRSDYFSYTISDGEYQAMGIVEVSVGSSPEAGGTLNILGTSVGADGWVRLDLIGIPGRSYAIQMTMTLANPAWTTVGSARADAAGRFQFVHENPPGGAAFYRARQTTGAALR